MDELSENNTRSTIYKVELDEQGKNDVRIIASEFIQPNSSVLDVGCACGDFGFYIARRKSCRVIGMEFDSDSIVEARKNGAYEELHQVDLNNLQPKDFFGYLGFFDYISLLDVLEHLSNPADCLIKLKGYLKEGGGEFLISVPNVAFGDIKGKILRDDFSYTDTGILDKTHLRFFTYKTLAIFLADAGLGVIECRAKVAPISWAQVTSLFIRLAIANNPHSHIYQYVLRVKPFDTGHENLLKMNHEKLNLNWGDLKFEEAGMSRSVILLRAILGKRFGTAIAAIQMLLKKLRYEKK